MKGFQFAWKIIHISKWTSEAEPTVVVTKFLSDTFSSQHKSNAICAVFEVALSILHLNKLQHLEWD